MNSYSHIPSSVCEKSNSQVEEENFISKRTERLDLIWKDFLLSFPFVKTLTEHQLYRFCTKCFVNVNIQAGIIERVV